MLEGLLAPLRVVLHRSFADWLIVAATWLVIVCATTLLAIGVLYGDAVSLSGLRQADRRPAGHRRPAWWSTCASHPRSWRRSTRSSATRSAASWDGPMASWRESSAPAPIDLAGAVPDVAETDLAVFAAADRLDRHATRRRGHVAGERRGAAGGGDLDRRRGRPRHRGRRRADADEPRAARCARSSVRIVGRWEPNDPDDPLLARRTSWSSPAVSRATSFNVHGPAGRDGRRSRDARRDAQPRHDAGGRCPRSRTSRSRTCGGCGATPPRSSAASRPILATRHSSASRPGCHRCWKEPIGPCWSAAPASWCSRSSSRCWPPTPSCSSRGCWSSSVGSRRRSCARAVPARATWPGWRSSRACCSSCRPRSRRRGSRSRCSACSMPSGRWRRPE